MERKSHNIREIKKVGIMTYAKGDSVPIN